MYYLRKCVNNGYGEMVKGFEEKEVSVDVVKEVWECRDSEKLDELVEKSGFGWNIGEDELEELLGELEGGWFGREYEEYICVLSEDRVKGLELLINMI